MAYAEMGAFHGSALMFEGIPDWVREQAKTAEAESLNELLDTCLTALAIVQRKAGVRAVISRVAASGFVTVTVTDAELKVASPYARMDESSRELKRESTIAIRKTDSDVSNGEP